MHLGVTGGMVNVPTLEQFDITSKEVGLMDMASHDLGQRGIGLNKQIAQSQPHINKLPNENQQLGMESMHTNSLGPQKKSLPSKRKAVEESIGNYNFAAQQLPTPNKNAVLRKPSISTPGLNRPSPINKRTIQVPSKPTAPLSSPSGRSGTKQVPPSKNRVTQLGSSPNVQNGSFESVRSKMRESLASAFMLSTHKQDKRINENTEQHSQQAETAVVCGGAANYVSEHPGHILPSEESHFPDTVADVCVTSQGISTDKASDSSQTWKGHRGLVQCSTVLSSTSVPSSDSSFVGDELLQGNGLNWVVDLEVESSGKKEHEIVKKPKLVSEDVGGQAVNSPKSLAFKIEQELFKFFGGVNKKYKEKGRSLLFNLKDPSNPVLREKVISGEITPERLCSMTAEELASEELAQWRVAKAEELAHMKVLPDSDVDIRRLVKKTHKGEFQVEFEQDEGPAVEISVGTGLHSGAQSKEKDIETRPSTKAGETRSGENVVSEKNSSENQNLSCSPAIPSNETDVMQCLMVDEMKDAEFLPPIVSLDEFMESLDKEPPFENLPLNDTASDKENLEGRKEATTAITASDNGNSEDGNEATTTIKVSQKGNSEGGNEATTTITAKDKGNSESENEATTTITATDKGNSEGGDESATTIISTDKGNSEGGNEPTTAVTAPGKGNSEGGNDATLNDVASKDTVDAASLDKSEKMDVNYPDQDVKMKEVAAEPKASPSVVAAKGEQVWEGALQLHISAMVTAVGFFRSGERTSAKEWSSSVEIKGRVRLDAFQKFLQELPMSRSRAVMVVHFDLPQGSTEDEKASLGEAIHSYVLDERVGFAEPAPGVEIYFCPPHKRTVDILMKNLSKDDHSETFNSIHSGLIGIIVWRKAHISSTKSPNSSSHHKHSTKRAHTTLRKQQYSYVSAQTGDEDEAPPGFGPGTTREEDDLPEFNFSSSLNPSMAFNSSTRYQVSSMASYGKTGTKRWNEDDDDIPEWQPQPPQQLMNNIPQAIPQVQQPQYHPPQFLQQQNIYQTQQLQGMVVWQQPSFAMPLQLPGQFLQNPGLPGGWVAAPSPHFGVQQLQVPQQQTQLQQVILGGQAGSGGEYYGVAGQPPGAGWGNAAPRNWGY